MKKTRILGAICAILYAFLTMPANAASITITPNPITFVGVPVNWNVTAVGNWDGSVATFGFDLSGIFEGSPVAWQFAFDGTPFAPSTVTADFGTVLSGVNPTIFAFDSTANGNVTYSLGFLPGTISTTFDNGVSYAALALATTSAVPIPTAVWLFGSGLLGLIGVARRKKTP